MNLGKKIRMYREKLKEEFGTTQKSIADEIGVDVRTLQNYEKDETTPDATVISKLAKIFNTTPQELLNDNESVVSAVVSGTEKNVVSYQNFVVNPSNLKNSQIEQIESDQIYIRQLSSSVGAGESVDIDGIEIYDTDVLVPFSKMLFKIRPKNIDHVRCMRVDGCSMAPMLFPDSWVIADVTSKFSGDGLYIVNYCGNFMVKLLQKAPDGTLSIISINKDYKSYEIGPDNQAEVYIVGKVLRCVI